MYVCLKNIVTIVSPPLPPSPTAVRIYLHRWYIDYQVLFGPFPPL